MKANELRIGNWVNWGQDFQLDLGSLTQHYYNDVLQPIPLTEEWLEKFGFVKENRHAHYRRKIYSKWLFDHKYSFAYAWFRGDWGFYHSWTDAPSDKYKFDFISCGINYVHQLQNLYFALTGEELTIK